MVCRLILDANIVMRALGLSPDRNGDFEPIGNALNNETNPTAVLVYGGKLREEYFGSTELVQRLIELTQSGNVQEVADEDVSRRESQIAGQCTSNDAHIIALALVGRVRLLCSDDKDLATDFTNPALVNRPRGSVYKNKSHSHLIKHHAR